MNKLFNKKTGIVALIIIVLLVVAGGAFYLGKGQKSTTEVQPTPQVTLSPTLAESPTPTATPTATPRPTATPTPTNTPTPTPIPGVVNIETSVNPTTSNTCTQTFTFTAKIYTNGAATVTYHWLRSDNATDATKTITFTSASMQTVTDTWTRGPVGSGSTVSGWERVEILTPNSTLGNKAEFTLSCP